MSHRRRTSWSRVALGCGAAIGLCLSGPEPESALAAETFQTPDARTVAAGAATPEPGSTLDTGATEPLSTGAFPAPESGDLARGGSGFPPPEPVDQPYLPGWPVEIGMDGNIPRGIALADVDGDRDLEILAPSVLEQFWVWHHDGTPLPGWPVELSGETNGKCAAGDLDGDGDLEIVIVTHVPPLVRVEVLHHDGTSLAGWPQLAETGYGPVAPSLYDLDGDAVPEVLWGNVRGVVAWHADGTRVAGFPIDVPGTISATLAIGDLDGDGSPEIFCTSVDPDDDFSTWISCFRADGRRVRGFPHYSPHISGWGAPSIGDLDGDGRREALAMTCELHAPAGSDLYAFDYRGQHVPGFPIHTISPQSYSSPVLADADHDGDLEIFQTYKALGGYDVPGWDDEGQMLPGWPVFGSGTLGPGNLECSPIVANFDGDPELEVVFADNLSPGTMFGHNLDGSYVDGFNFWALPGIAGPASPAVGDVDLDGDLDLAMTMYPGVVAVWDLDVAWDPALAAWPTNYHDNWNTNQHGFVPPDQVPSDVPAVPTAQAQLRLHAAPNPFRISTNLVLSTPPPGRVVVDIHDARGRRIRTWTGLDVRADGTMLTWDGRDQSGTEVPSGAYLIRTRIGEAVSTGVVTVVR